MPREQATGKPTTRRHSREEKQAAVRMVRSLRAETRMTDGSVRRVAEQLGYGVESVRTWVKRADVDDGRDLSANCSARPSSGPTQKARIRGPFVLIGETGFEPATARPPARYRGYR
jgi:transposase-like protein